MQGSYLRLIDFWYHSTLGLRVIKKREEGLGFWGWYFVDWDAEPPYSIATAMKSDPLLWVSGGRVGNL